MRISKINKIRIVGCGCNSCETLEKNIISVSKRIGLDFIFSKVCEYETKMTPILFINDQLVSSGEIPTIDKLEIILKKLKEIKNEKD